MERKWTADQTNAIEARRGTILVSAAAGSGKTTVLVERVLRRLTDPVAPTDADRLLIVTFTRAAAAEMKQRLQQGIQRLLEQHPEDAHLRRQQVLLRRAQISTIHSFCGNLVRENFYKLGISPAFAIQEEDSGALQVLRLRAMDTVLEAAYGEKNPAFYDLIALLGCEKDDRKLADTIQRVYTFTRSHPFPEQWMAETEAQYQSGRPMAETPWGQVLQTQIRETIRYGKSLMKTAMERLEAEGDEKLCGALLPLFSEDLATLEQLEAQCQSGDWDTLCRALQSCAFGRFATPKGYKDDPLKEQVSGLRKTMKDAIEKLDRLLLSEAQCQADLHRQSGPVRVLFQLVRRYDAVLTEYKAERNLADFGDLERWTLRLLYQTEEDRWVRTPEAERIAQQFDEIIVDEYQDTNPAQDAIFRAISKAEQNLFLVGDVKQSIYGFRQASPQLFLERREHYPLYDPALDAYPATILLGQNFRSRKTVTDTVNTLFRQLMSRESGGVDYNAEEALRAAADYPPQTGMEPEIQILECQDKAESDAAAEARWIAEKIQSMVSAGVTITKNGQQVPVGYGDFAILLRKANRYMDAYARELALWGIPVKLGGGSGFLQTPEIAVVVSLLRVISNPMQDIPLTAVLMSSIYGFTPDEMALIRSKDRKGSFYSALRQCAEQMPKAASFLQELETMRTVSVTMSTDQLLRYLYEKTGYPDLVQAMEYGNRRLANLELLLEYAASLDANGCQGVSGFVRILDRLEEQGLDLKAAELVQGSDSAVQIMSIHKSKGLEFPVCIVAGCGHLFNRQKEATALHRTLGFGVKLREETLPCSRTTLMQEAIWQQEDQETIAEELRIFYVAVTRAKEKLILLCSVKDLDQELLKYSVGLGETERIHPFLVRSAKHYAEWILRCALRHPDGAGLRERIGIPLPVLQNSSTTHWIIETHPVPAPFEAEPASAMAYEPDPMLLEQLRRQIAYRYPYEAVLQLPSKVTASALSEREHSGNTNRTLARPAFCNQGGLTAAQKGTATHAFLQYCDVTQAQADLETEIDRLVRQGFLSEQEGNAVHRQQVQTFFAHPLAKRMWKAEQLWREYRFAVEIPAGIVMEEARDTEELLLLQGAVDCLFVENGKLVLVDYKTDHVTEGEQLREKYRKQVQLYAMAMEACFGLPVQETLLYSFWLGDTVSVENPR